MKHHIIHHGGVGEPSFHLRPVKFLKTALTRQISEAIRISKWGEERVINSKGEYNRCKIGRLTLENQEGDHKNLQEDRGLREVGENTRDGEKMIEDWERSTILQKRVEELQGKVDLRRGVAKTTPSKRHGSGEQSPAKKKKSKWKYPLLDQDWGEDVITPPTSPEKVPTSPPPPPTPPPLQNVIIPEEPNITTIPPPTEASNNLPSKGEESKILSPSSRHQDTCSPPQEIKEDNNPPEDNLRASDKLPSKGKASTKLSPSSRHQDACLPYPEIKEDNNPPEDNLKEDIPVRKVRRSITINGVDITEYQKKLEALKNTTTKDKKQQQTTTKNNRKKDQQNKETKTTKKQQENNTTLQKITTFFNKQEDDNNLKTKETFNNINMKEKITEFQKLSQGEKCVFGSGRCATHNCKLVRSVTQKKRSVINNEGEISWPMTDVTCLKCPKGSQTKPFTGVNTANHDISDPAEQNKGTNKKLRLSVESDNDQSAIRLPIIPEIRKLQVDNNAA